MWTSGASMGSRRLELLKVSVISAAFIPRRVGEPLKITSAISLPRRLLTLCSPRTHLMPSTTFDLPDPLGPTTTVIPGGNSNRVLSAKLLKPASSSALSMAKKGCESRTKRFIIARKPRQNYEFRISSFCFDVFLFARGLILLRTFLERGLIVPPRFRQGIDFEPPFQASCRFGLLNCLD